ncbi:MAG: transcriptional repressor LexA [Coxiellaceae bacterium]|nr:transcriptional repressor LexA [Coxiellaceae bacterium]
MLTLSQRKTEEFIRKFFDKHGYAPTASEIAEGIGIKSRGVVHRYLKALEEAGRIALTPKRHRNIRILDPVKTLLADLTPMPLLGSIAAGQPIEAIPQQDSIDVASIFVGPNRYALKVKGDSMIDEGILDGDVVICERANVANNGQIVVALIDQEEATLKRLESKQGMVTLHPANSRLKPMEYDSDRVTIQGIYIGLVRF